MNRVLYLSSLASDENYKKMFEKYGSTLSHASQKFNKLIVGGLIQNGYDVDAVSQVILPFGISEKINRAEECDGNVKYTYLPRKKNLFLNRLVTILSAFRAIRKWQHKNPTGTLICDIICGELSIAVFLARIFCKRRAIAIVTDVPSIRAGDTRRGLRSIPRKIKNSLIFSYDGYIFLTEQMNQTLNPKGKPYVVIEGIVDEHVKDIPNLLEFKYSEKVCIMAGLLEEFYGVDILLNAFMMIPNPDARLIFYGHGKSVEKIKDAAKKDCRIFYKGELTNEQIVAEEKKAALLINPRPPTGDWTAYSFPSKNMEYMASGTPMLAYWLPCIPEEYRPYFYAVEEDNEELFKEKLSNVLKQDRAELHSLGMASQQWIITHKNAIAQTKKITNMIDTMQKGKYESCRD